jgi:kynurenine formamidase
LKLVDLSRELSHKMPRLPNHPMVIIAPFTTHAEKRVADGYTFSTAVTSLNNLDQPVGKGRFRFIGFPLKIKGGSGSPIRAVALLDDE